MSIIRKSDFKAMNEKQLNEKLEELKKELMKANTQISMGTTPENPGRVKTIKKTIARIMMYHTQLKNKPQEKPSEEKQGEDKDRKEDKKKQ